MKNFLLPFLVTTVVASSAVAGPYTWGVEDITTSHDGIDASDTIFDRIEDELALIGPILTDQGLNTNFTSWDNEVRDKIEKNGFHRLQQYKSGAIVWGTEGLTFDQLIESYANDQHGTILNGGLYSVAGGWEIWIQTSNKGWLKVSDVNFSEAINSTQATQIILQETFDTVFSVGFKDGYDKGFDDGYEAGYADGYIDGFWDGYDAAQ